jgi:general secretion pathway protein I
MWISAASFPDRQGGEMASEHANKGFTLLEIMVTVSVMAIVLVSIFHLHSQTISMNIDAKFNAIAPFLARQKIAELELVEPGELANASGDFADDFPGFTWKIDLEDIQADALTTSGIYFKKIVVSIGYNSDQNVYDLITYRFVYENI